MLFCARAGRELAIKFEGHESAKKTISHRIKTTKIFKIVTKPKEKRGIFTDIVSRKDSLVSLTLWLSSL